MAEGASSNMVEVPSVAMQPCSLHYLICACTLITVRKNCLESKMGDRESKMGEGESKIGRFIEHKRKVK